MWRLLNTLVLNFFIAFGMVTGGALLGSLSTLLTRQPPLNTMADLADKLKIWGLVAALGGTFPALKAIETGFLGGHLESVVKQLLLLTSAFSGAHAAYIFILYLSGGVRG
ncbi:MAG TPA: sporulation protein [Firmicutes bacterium]|nr:sporulation protein [Bacillota bacterium]